MSLLFDKGTPNFCITMRHVVYILDLSMTLTFDLYVGGRGGGVSLVGFTPRFFLVFLDVLLRGSRCAF